MTNWWRTKFGIIRCHLAVLKWQWISSIWLPCSSLQFRYVWSDITSLPSPLSHNEYLTLALKMESILGVHGEADRTQVALYFLFLILFKESQTTEEQMLHASFCHALTRRGKVKRQLKLLAILNFLGQVVSKKYTLRYGKKPRYCHPGSWAISPL